MKNLPKLQIRIENRGEKAKQNDTEEGKYLLYSILVVIFLIVGGIVVYTLNSTKGFRCERYAVNKAQEKIEDELSRLVTKTEPTPDDLEMIEKYKEMVENGEMYQKDKEYYYNQCMYK